MVRNLMFLRRGDLWVTVNWKPSLSSILTGWEPAVSATHRYPDLDGQSPPSCQKMQLAVTCVVAKWHILSFCSQMIGNSIFWGGGYLNGTEIWRPSAHLIETWFQPGESRDSQLLLGAHAVLIRLILCIVKPRRARACVLFWAFLQDPFPSSD